MKEAIDDVLNFLFEKFLDDPYNSFVINSICKKHKKDQVLLSQHLEESGLIEDRYASTADVVMCRITLKGILAIRPEYIDESRRKIVNGLAKRGGKGEIRNLLGLHFAHRSIIDAIAMKIAEDGLIIVSRPTLLQVFVELTEKGWALSE